MSLFYNIHFILLLLFCLRSHPDNNLISKGIWCHCNDEIESFWMTSVSMKAVLVLMMIHVADQPQLSINRALIFLCVQQHLTMNNVTVLEHPSNCSYLLVHDLFISFYSVCFCLSLSSKLWDLFLIHFLIIYISET